MKKKYLVFGLFTISSIYGFGQSFPNPYPKKKVSWSDIQVVYSQYIQDGDHSAITGGIGTQKLLVYAPEITYNHQLDSLTSYSVDAGVDVITSASLDNIDFVPSSASRVSKRVFITPGFERVLKKNHNITLGASGYFSMESVYTSLGGSASGAVTSSDKSRAFSATLEMYFDDLRWGRLNGERPLKLVYPAELRYKNWFAKYQRKSYTLNLNYQQTINKRMILGILPGLSYQQGLLSTTYHRVYFNDGVLKVENFPFSRWKVPVGIQLNSFIGDSYILRTYYRFYWDNFQILAHTFDLEFEIKLTPGFSLTPQARFYTQTAAFFFRPFERSEHNQLYYSSDYDYAAFQAYEAGLEADFGNLGKGQRNIYFNNLSLRYSFYKRTDGLYNHMITLLIGVITRKRVNAPPNP
jgi:Protein of unknown function (DUF3570)